MEAGTGSRGQNVVRGADPSAQQQQQQQTKFQLRKQTVCGEGGRKLEGMRGRKGQTGPKGPGTKGGRGF